MKNEFCYVYADSVEDGEKLIQTALDAFGRIGVYKPSMEILRPLVLIPVTTDLRNDHKMIVSNVVTVIH